MDLNTKWTKQQMLDLYRYKFEEGKSTKEISILINRSIHSISQKLKRTNWENFISSPDSENQNAKKWTQAEMGLLCAFLDEKKSYNYISEKIGRSHISVERKAQTTGKPI